MPGIKNHILAHQADISGFSAAMVGAQMQDASICQRHIVIECLQGKWVTMNDNNSRSEYWQIIRGVCILAVVLIHCPTGVPYGNESLEFGSWMAIRQFINFPVAIFIFLSGYFANVNKVLENSKTWILNRGGRLLIPYLFWSTVYSGVTCITSIINHDSINIERLIYNFFTGKASRQLYYIIVLVQLTIITPWLIKQIKKGNLISKFLWLITPVYLTFLYAYNFIYHRAPMLYATIFPAWFAFYYFGLHVRIKKAYFKNVKSIEKGVCMLVPIGISFSLLEAFILNKITHNSSFAVSQIKLSCFFVDVGLIIMLLSFARKKSRMNAGILNWIGDYSYGIFYVHCLFMFLIENVLISLGVNQTWILYFFSTFVITTLLSGLFVYYIRIMLLKQKVGRKILNLIGF